MVYVWWLKNRGNGPRGFATSSPYHGVCYPAECSMKDIHTNNLQFAQQLWPGEVYLASSPLLPFPGSEYWVTGCSDDEEHRYDGWRDVSTAAITVLSLIAVLICLGTILDIFERNRTMSMGAINVKEVSKGLGFKLLTSFSLVSNMEVIFQEPAKKGGNRLDCLDGIRAISMTWVILGHNFSAGRGYLHGRNKEYLDSILRDNAAGVAFIAFDMEWFLVAPLVVYPLWKSKFGRFQTHLGIMW